jgi:hypothetical protein
MAAAGLKSGPLASIFGHAAWYWRLAPAVVVAIGSGLHWLIDQFLDRC